MQNTGFRLVDGDAADGMAPAIPRHWIICAVFVIIAQWLLDALSAPTTAIATLVTHYAFADPLLGSSEGDWWLAIPSIAWLVVPFAAVGCLTIYLSRRFDGRGHRSLGLHVKAAREALPWLIGGLFASFLSIVRLFTLDFGGEEAALGALPWLIPATLVQSGAEEVLFRGALLAMLVARYGARGGVLISAALFALWHLYPGQGLVDTGVLVVTTFIFGVSSAVLTLHQGHIGGAIALHLVWNVVLSVEAGLANWGGGHGILGMFQGGSFWESYTVNYTRPVMLEDVQSGAALRSMFFPLFFETVLVFAACRLTFDRIFFGAPRALAVASAIDPPTIRE